MQNLNEKKVSVKAGVIAGFIACCVSAVVMMFATSAAIAPQFDYVVLQGFIIREITTAFLSAWALYFITGTFLWGWLYAITEQYLKGTPTLKGTIFGIGFWLVSMLVLMPIANAGFFAMKYGIAAAGIALATSLSFGISLGFFYDRLREKRGSALEVTY